MPVQRLPRRKHPPPDGTLPGLIRCRGIDLADEARDHSVKQLDTDVPVRLLFGSAMLVSIVLGVFAIRRRDFVRHGAWITRGYAIGVAAGTQALVILPWILLVGTPDELTRALLMTAAWVTSLAVAEYVTHQRARQSARASRTSRPAGLSVGTVARLSR